jgi:hypothetical protein
MMSELKLYFLLFFSVISFTQTKDSLQVLMRLKAVPEKYKLEHFGLNGKVKTMECHFGPYESDFLIYEFDIKGNLMQIVNAAKQSKRSYAYDEKGKLKSYQYGKRTVEVELDASDNITKQTIQHQDRETKTILNTFDKNGFWLSQKVMEDNQLMLENEYDKNHKLITIKSYSTGKLSNQTMVLYVFYKKFVQIQHKTIAVESGNLSETYFYLDYYGNEIIGFNPEEQKPSQVKINDVFSVFILDKNNNWLKAKTDYGTIYFRQFTYY